MTDIRKAAEEIMADESLDPAILSLVKSDPYAARWLIIAGAEWMREQAAQEAEAINDFYPLDLWPPVTTDQLAALHEFARSLGMPDGSRFHVGGVRHGVTLSAAAIRKIGENGD